MKSAAEAAVIVRAALSCVACNIPAARKVCGFVGHNARLACSKCLKVFETEAFGDKPDFSGLTSHSGNLDKILLVVSMHLNINHAIHSVIRKKFNVTMVADTLYCWN